MSGAHLGIVVEGHGDAAALPVLARRIAAERFQNYTLTTSTWRLPRSQATSSALARAVRLVAYDVASSGASSGGVLVVFDADRECPVELADSIRGVQVGPGAVGIAIANREYEAWILAAIESLAQNRLVRDATPVVGDPDALRNPKATLDERLHSRYKVTSDQEALSGSVDLELACGNSRSFRHLCDAIGRLLTSAIPD